MFKVESRFQKQQRLAIKPVNLGKKGSNDVVATFVHIFIPLLPSYFVTLKLHFVIFVLLDFSA